MKNLVVAVLGLFAGTTMAAEIYVISAGAARGAVVPLIERFQKESGHTIKFDYGTMGQIQAKLKEGQRPDVLIVTTTVIAELEKSGAVVAGSSTPLGRTSIGVGVLDSAPSPDISSVDAFRKTLLAARAVAYIDPAVGGTSGKHFAGILTRLGIEPQVKAKAVWRPGRAAPPGFTHPSIASRRLRTRIQPGPSHCSRMNATCPPALATGDHSRTSTRSFR